MHPLAPGSCRRVRAGTGSLHGQPSAERPSPIVPDERRVHDNGGLATQRSKASSTDARQRHRYRVLLHSTRHHSLTPPRTEPACGGARMHEFGRDYQPPFDNVKRRLRVWELAFTGAVGTNASFETTVDPPPCACENPAPRAPDPVIGTRSRTPPATAPTTPPLKHDGDPLPGSPSVIPQRAHGRVGRVLWEIGTRSLKLASAPKVATRDLQSQLPYLESPTLGA
jgi:hypothetical protein